MSEILNNYVFNNYNFAERVSSRDSPNPSVRSAIPHDFNLIYQPLFNTPPSRHQWNWVQNPLCLYSMFRRFIQAPHR